MKIKPLGNRQNGSFLFDGYLIKVHRRSANMQIINGFLFDGYLIEN